VNRQTERALHTANRIKRERYAVLLKIRASPPDTARFLTAMNIRHPDEPMARCPLMLLLRELPRVRESTARFALAHIGAHEHKAIGDLTPRQAELLAQTVERVPPAKWSRL
jgi:hypothetical protein